MCNFPLLTESIWMFLNLKCLKKIKNKNFKLKLISYEKLKKISHERSACVHFTYGRFISFNY